MARPMPGPRGEVQAVFDLLADRPLGGQPCSSRADSSFDSLDRWFGKDCFAVFHNEGCSACTKGGHWVSFRLLALMPQRNAKVARLHSKSGLLTLSQLG